MFAAIAFLINTFVGLYALAFVLRFLLAALRAPWHHPISQFLIRITRPLLIGPRLPAAGVDLSPLLLAWLLLWLKLLLLATLAGGGAAIAAMLLPGLALAALETARLLLYVFMGAVFVEALLSFVNPASALAPLLARLTRPVLSPFRRILPPIAGLDLSPLFALITGQFLLIFPVGWLEAIISGPVRI